MTTEQQKQIAPEDLDLIPQQMADTGKTDEEIWRDIDDGEAAKANGALASANIDQVGADFDEGDAGTQAEADATAIAEPGAKPGAEPDNGADDASGAAQKPDIWATATLEQRAAYDELRADRDKLDHRIRSDDGRVAALQRRIKELNEAAKPAAARSEHQSASEAIAALTEDYPELAEPLKQALGTLDDRIGELNSAEEGRRTMAAQTLSEAQAEYKAIVDEETRKLTEQHPDWLGFLNQNGSKFAAWVDDQPRRVREAFQRNYENIVNADEVGEVLDAFKKHMTPPAGAASGDTDQASDPNPNNHQLDDRRRRQLDASAAPRGKKGRATPTGIPKEGDPEEIWKMWDAADSAA